MKISIISHLICRIKGYAQKEGNIPPLYFPTPLDISNKRLYNYDNTEYKKGADAVNNTMTDSEQMRKMFADLKQTAFELENSDLSPSEQVFMLSDALSESVDGKAQYDTCERIDEIAKHSLLLGDSLISGSAALILKRGLTEIATYENMGEILSDLDILENNIKKLSRPEKPSAKQSKKKKLLEKPAAAMIGALYKTPIINSSGGKHINVLVLGNNEYTRLFTDLCLQLCQIADRSLHILDAFFMRNAEALLFVDDEQT